MSKLQPKRSGECFLEPSSKKLKEDPDTCSVNRPDEEELTINKSYMSSGCQTDEPFDNPILPLTKKNLRILEKMSSPESSRKRSRGKITNDASMSSSRRGFSKAIIPLGVFPFDRGIKPANFEALVDSIRRSRKDSPFSTEEVSRFMLGSSLARNEMTIMLHTAPLLFDCQDQVRDYGQIYDQRWESFPIGDAFHDIDVSPPQPDLVEGLRVYGLHDMYPVLKELGDSSITDTTDHGICLPHFAGEWKGPHGDTAIAWAQVAWTGACMVYGRTVALKYLGVPSAEDTAHVLTFIINPTGLKIFAHFSQCSELSMFYYMTQIFSSDFLQATPASLTAIRNALRNAQELSKVAALELMDKLESKHRSV